VEPGTNALVRSGPGTEQYYATLKLSPGDKVHVLRKDPGGWYMIDPPPGSYSWVNAVNVDPNGNQARSSRPAWLFEWEPSIARSAMSNKCG